jgi:hypothetical protein
MRWGASIVTYANGVLVSPTRRGRLTFGMLHELDNLSRTDTRFSRLLAVTRRNT